MEKVHCYVLFILILRAEKKGRHDANFVVSGGTTGCHHDDVIKWKHFSRYCPFVHRIHWSPVNSPHKGQWHGALILSLINAWINGRVNNREAGDLGCHHAHYDITVMISGSATSNNNILWKKQILWKKLHHKVSIFQLVSWFHADYLALGLLLIRYPVQRNPATCSYIK